MIYKTKNGVTGTPLKTWGVLRCSGWIVVPVPQVSLFLRARESKKKTVLSMNTLI
jgi:hypothetical protein